jgi:hypothetical protein
MGKVPVFRCCAHFYHGEKILVCFSLWVSSQYQKGVEVNFKRERSGSASLVGLSFCMGCSSVAKKKSKKKHLGTVSRRKKQMPLSNFEVLKKIY